MTMGTCSTQAYGEAWYWDKRYAHEPGPFDWYQSYSAMAPLINLYLPRSHRHHRILVVGCGNSAFSEGMVDDGYEEVVSIDISSVVIEAMQKKHSDRPQLKYMKMDVRDMSVFPTGSFDAVIDKGTLDSLLLMTNYRVLKDKGVYILITYGAPTYRLRLLRDSGLWTIKLHVIEKLVSGESSEHPIWKLIDPLPLGDDGSSVEAVLGKNPDIHYIYVCTKVDKKFVSGESYEHPIWKLTDHLPLGDDGSSVEAVLGKNPDIHYIYICTKDISLKTSLKPEMAVD